MKKQVILKWINVVLFFSFFIQAISGVLIDKAHAIKEVHEVNGFILALISVAHVAFNWGWIRSQIFSRT